LDIFKRCYEFLQGLRLCGMFSVNVMNVTEHRCTMLEVSLLFVHLNMSARLNQRKTIRI